MQKWTRNYILSVQTEGDKYITITPPLTLSFHITRNTNAAASTSKITIYNLAENTRKQIYKDKFDTMHYKGVELRAGYGTDRRTLPIIFKGNIKQAYSFRNGVDYITEIEAYDGGFAYLNGVTSRSFGVDTTDGQIIDALIKDLPEVEKGVVGSFPNKLPKGNALYGNTVKLLNTASNNHFFIDNEKAYCLNENECYRGNLSVINSEAGLLGSPLREETFLTFTMLFEPRLTIGQYVKLESTTEKLFNGEYKVLGVEHNGTISEVSSGQCTTRVSLYYGIKKLVVL